MFSQFIFTENQNNDLSPFLHYKKFALVKWRINEHYMIHHTNEDNQTALMSFFLQQISIAIYKLLFLNFPLHTLLY